MAITYEPIATNTLSSATSSVTFSSIPQTYTDLVLVVFGKNTSTADNFQLTMNNDTASNYSYVFFAGNGSSSSTGIAANATPMYVGNMPSSAFALNTIHINNYTNTTSYKTALSFVGGNNAQTWVNSWRSNSAITTLKVGTGTGNYAIGSSFTLFGIKAA